MRDIILTQIGKDKETEAIEIEYEYASDKEIPIHKRPAYEIRITKEDAKILATTIKSKGY